MISTEVQRTLVKSPPELWAELSDPAALARHLGELGEIRITRLQPGEKVEWEAADASGTVVLKPSGWGTKVTLTATSNAQAPPAEAAEEPSSKGTPAHATPEQASPDASSSKAQSSYAPPPDALASTAPTPGAPAPDAPAPATAEPPVPTPSMPEPAAPAARGPAPDAPPGPAIEAWRKLAAAATAETGFPQAPLRRTARADASATGDGPAPVQSEPRRGFFARLFRRRRRAVVSVAPPTSSAAAQPPSPEPAPDATTEPASTPRLAPAPALSAGGASAKPRLDEPGERPAEPTAAEAPSPDGAASATLAEADPGGAQEATPSAPDPPGPDAGPATPLGPDAVEDADLAAQDSGSASRLEPVPGEEAIQDGVAADRVTAVLTATLDRLGAAHHRPFSRA